MQNEKLELPGESYFVSDIQGSFEYIAENQKTVTDNPSLKIYIYIKSCMHVFPINRLVNLDTTKIFNFEFSYIEVWFTGKNSKPIQNIK